MRRRASTIWDPLGIADSVGDEALMWFRAAERKHGRVAMLATVGYLTGAAGITFPGEIGDASPSSERQRERRLQRVVERAGGGRLQILGLIFLLELSTESKKPHYAAAASRARSTSSPSRAFRASGRPS